MRKLFILLAVIGIIAMTSCHKNNNGPGILTLKINPMFGSNPMALNQVFSAPDGKYYSFQHFKFYLSHIKLIQSNGNLVEVDSLAFFTQEDPATWNVHLANIPGSYTGIQYNIGLDAAQDTTPESLYDTTSPYYYGNYTYWTSALEYVFVQIDGYGDTTPNPTTIITYHVGTQANYMTASTLSKTFSTSANSQTVLNLTVNLQNVFYNSADTGVINITTNPVTQTSDYPVLAHTFITEFPKVFSLQ